MAGARQAASRGEYARQQRGLARTRCPRSCILPKVPCPVQQAGRCASIQPLQPGHRCAIGGFRAGKPRYRMSAAPKIAFSSFTAPSEGVLIAFCGDGVEFGSATREALGKAADLVRRAAKAERFSGKSGTSLELLLPDGLNVD